MKILGAGFIILLFIVSVVLLAIGITTWVNSLNDPNIAGTFFGMLFGIVFAVLGGVALILDLILLVIFKRKRKVS